jgi:hypothetical protein
MLPLSVAVCAAMGCSEGWAESVVQGGSLEVPFGDFGEEEYDPQKAKGGGKLLKYYRFTGINATKLPIKDFELELVNCGNAKFEEIKILPEVDLNKEFPPDGRSADVTSDWDVDDDMSGLSNQDDVGDPNAPGGIANETDNVDSSPDSKARVDANGAAGGTSQEMTRSGAQADNRARRAGTEDGRETKPGNEAPGHDSAAPLDGPGGIQPDHKFEILIRFTQPPQGKNCKIIVQPSGKDGLLITGPGVLKPKQAKVVPAPVAPPAGEGTWPEAPSEETPPGAPAEEKPPEKPEDGKSAETPEGKKVGQAPGGCPEGKFMGGLGSLLGLEVACEDPSRRRDTDRGDHRGDEHKD